MALADWGRVTKYLFELSMCDGEKDVFNFTFIKEGGLHNPTNLLREHFFRIGCATV